MPITEEGDLGYGFSTRIAEYVTRIRTLKIEFNTYDYSTGDKNSLYAAIPLN